jgi:dihydrofolate reductase
MITMKYLIVAYDSNRGIGADNDLLWQRNLPADLRRFKQLTTGHSIVMGRKTYDSIGRPLPDRQNIVVSRSVSEIPGVTVVDSLAAAYVAAEQDVYVIGGGSIYAQALPDIDVIYATEVQADFPNATVFFPALGQDWRETAREHHEADERNLYAYDFVTYERR